VGGWTRWTDADPQEQIYLFDRASGKLVRRIEGLPSRANHVAFSPDGQRLAAVLGSVRGLRIYGRDQGWAEIGRDTHYGDQSYGVAFAPDGRLATTALDGVVRLYASDPVGDARPAVEIAAPSLSGRWPHGIAFSPDGSRLAVAYDRIAAIDLLDGCTLRRQPGPNCDGIAEGDLSTVAWSRDGESLFAAGTWGPVGSRPIVAWSDAGTGARRVLPAGCDTVCSLVSLPEHDLLVAAGDPWFARLRMDGSARWMHRPPKVDFRDQFDRLWVASDGIRIGFGFAQFGKAPAQFDLATRTLSLDPSADSQMAPPHQDGLPRAGWNDTTAPTFSGRRLVSGWYNTNQPSFNGQPLELEPHELSRSAAVHPSGDRCVLGSEWALRAFDATGTTLWSRPVPGDVWAVNITGDGRLVVAAYGDGTIRWHRMDDGVELLAFMPLPDRTNWVAWTPEGFYSATAGAHSILRWHVNRGWDAAADSEAIEDIPGSYRPAMPPLVLQQLETPRALGLAVMAEHKQQVMLRTNSRLPPGIKLHLLTIGISLYNEDFAKNLRLHYADRDAHDLASAILNTQTSLYADVKPQRLLNRDANKAGIARALASMRADMEKGGGNDLAVVHFSGHGALVRDELYLLPYEVDARDDPAIETTALSIGYLRGKLLELAKHGRVLVLLDACHSGATTMGGVPLAMDSTALRTTLAQANVTVLTSSSGRTVSREDDAWQHGAFTKVLLDALSDPAADVDRNGLISTTGLAHYVAQHVSSLTGNAQTPDMEVRFDTTVFALAL
jgi:WD40 repeat protein